MEYMGCACSRHGNAGIGGWKGDAKNSPPGAQKTAILIAWLIASGNHSQNSPSRLQTKGYKILIAPISYDFGMPEIHEKTARSRVQKSNLTAKPGTFS